jgi:hypothetical protein
VSAYWAAGSPAARGYRAACHRPAGHVARAACAESEPEQRVPRGRRAEVADWPGDRSCQAGCGRGRGRDDRAGRRTAGAVCRVPAGVLAAGGKRGAASPALPGQARREPGCDHARQRRLRSTIGDAPGVYDPGGRTCQIDDFAVTPDRWATAGPLLLRSAIEQAAQRGAVQAVVVTGHLDQPKRDALRSCGLSVASEWWVSSWPRKSLLTESPGCAVSGAGARRSGLSLPATARP